MHAGVPKLAPPPAAGNSVSAAAPAHAHNTRRQRHFVFADAVRSDAELRSGGGGAGSNGVGGSGGDKRARKNSDAGAHTRKGSSGGDEVIEMHARGSDSVGGLVGAAAGADSASAAAGLKRRGVGGVGGGLSAALSALWGGGGGGSADCNGDAPHGGVDSDGEPTDYIWHDVKAEDTMQGLAVLYAVNVGEIKRRNKFITNNDLHTRSRIIIPTRKYGLLTEQAREKKAAEEEQELRRARRRERRRERSMAKKEERRGARAKENRMHLLEDGTVVEGVLAAAEDSTRFPVGPGELGTLADDDDDDDDDDDKSESYSSDGSSLSGSDGDESAASGAGGSGSSSESDGAGGRRGGRRRQRRRRRRRKSTVEVRTISIRQVMQSPSHSTRDYLHSLDAALHKLRTGPSPLSASRETDLAELAGELSQKSLLPLPEVVQRSKQKQDLWLESWGGSKVLVVAMVVVVVVVLPVLVYINREHLFPGEDAPPHANPNPNPSPLSGGGAGGG